MILTVGAGAGEAAAGAGEEEEELGRDHQRRAGAGQDEAGGQGGSFVPRDGGRPSLLLRIREPELRAEQTDPGGDPELSALHLPPDQCQARRPQQHHRHHQPVRPHRNPPGRLRPLLGGFFGARLR